MMPANKFTINELFSIDSVYALLLQAFVIVLPISILANNITIMALIVMTLFLILSKKVSLNDFNFNRKVFLIYLCYYLWILIGIIYSSKKHDGFKQAELQLSFILFPLIFAFTPKQVFDKYKNRVIVTFVLTIIFLALYTEIVEIISLINKSEPFSYLFRWRHSSYNLTESINLQPTYFSIFNFFAIVNLLFYLKIKTYNRLLISLALLFLIFFQFHLVNRTGIILMTLYLFVITPSLFKFSKKISLIYRIVLIIVIVLGVTNLTWVKQKFIDKNVSINSSDDKITIKTPSRILRWQAALDVCMSNFFIGTGTGDTIDELIKSYKKYGLEEDVEKQYNSHNQYIQSFAAHGIVGLCLLFLVFGYPIKILRKRDLLATIIVVSFSFYSITESTLKRQKGVVFYAFFSSFFIGSLKSKKELEL